MNKADIVQPAKTASFLSATQGILQRKCACGNHTMAGGECAECTKKKMGLQRKLTIGASNDPLEREADRIAGQVMAAPAHHVVNSALPRIQRFTGQAVGDTESAPASVGHVLVSPGRSLDPALRQDMEQRFGYDFSRVRVHSDAAAEQSAREVDAQAYTVGDDIVFGAGRFAPGTQEGRRLIAHELTHVLQQSGAPGIGRAQGMLVQRKKDKPKAEEKKGPTRLYEHRYRGHLITKYSVKGIDFFVGVHESMITQVEASLDAIGAAIVVGNKWITNPSLKVVTCIIAPSTTRYATYQGKPVLVLDPPDANGETATHEMGHAIFEQYRTTADQPKSATKDVGLVIADIYTRLAGTKVVQDNERDASGGVKEADHPAGLWIADPSQWSKTLASEHPWDNADEFFASARKAYLLDQKGFKAAIDKFTKLDSDVKSPANELLTVLSQLARGKVPKTPKTVSEGTAGELGRISGPSKVEDTLGSGLREVLQWTLDPSTIPQSKPAGPSLKAPEPEQEGA